MAAPLLIMLLWSDPQQAEALKLQSGTVLAPQKPIDNFVLSDQHGTPFTQSNFLGQWSLVLAGFTQCPDICPTTLSTLSRVEHILGTDTKRLQIVLVSVDPERDTSEVLSKYLGFFNPRIVGLTGEPNQLEIAYSALGIQRIRIPGARGDYSVDHSASVLLISPDGRPAGYFMPPFNANRLAADLAPLITPGR